ncbi:Anti-sigma-factor antagonist [Rhodospirillaceae bacterium LM-1]|nr:Anti-sigma-factor antagonist [Rhodospirillaceae bacterium LM-1]
MQHNIQASAGDRLVAISGRITSRDYDAFKGLLSMFDEAGVQRVVFDLSQVEFIDSSALGMIMLVRDKAKSKGATLTLQGVKGQVKRLMDVVKFDQTAN